MSDRPPHRLGDGSDPGRAWRAIMARSAARRAKVSAQSWSEFFRGFAVECAVVAAAVAVIATVLWLLHR